MLILGSGNVVHNLGLIQWGAGNAPYLWAAQFNATVRTRVEAGDVISLTLAEGLSESARLSVPTLEHYLPMLGTVRCA